MQSARGQRALVCIVYGSDAATAAKLRSGTGGKLITQDYTVQAYLPFKGINPLPTVAKIEPAVLYSWSETNSLPSQNKTGTACTRYTVAPSSATLHWFTVDQQASGASRQCTEDAG